MVTCWTVVCGGRERGTAHDRCLHMLCVTYTGIKEGFLMETEFAILRKEPLKEEKRTPHLHRLNLQDHRHTLRAATSSHTTKSYAAHQHSTFTPLHPTYEPGEYPVHTGQLEKLKRRPLPPGSSPFFSVERSKLLGLYELARFLWHSRVLLCVWKDKALKTRHLLKPLQRKDTRLSAWKPKPICIPVY